MGIGSWVGSGRGWFWLLLLLVPQVAGAAEEEAALESAEDTLLIADFKAVDVPPEEAAALNAEVAGAVAELSPYKVMTVSEINRMVELQKTLRDMGCSDESCVAELSKIANAKVVLTGSVGRVGDEYTFNIALVEVSTTTPLGHAARTSRTPGELREAIPDMVKEVLGDKASESKARYQLPEGKTISFAVLDLKPLGIEKDTAINLTEVLAAEVKGIEGTSVVSRSDIASMLQMEANKDAFDCTDDTSCLAEIGGALGVDQLIVGDVGKVGERFVVSLRIVDARNPQALSRVNESFEGLESQLVLAVKHAVRDLLGIAGTDPGEVVVEASEEEAVVSLNGNLLGPVPITDLTDVGAGRHTVLVTKPGFYDWRSDIYVAPFETTKVWAEMLEKPVRWVFWGFVGVTGAAAVGGTVTGLMARGEDLKAQDALANERPGFQDHRNKAASLALTANVFWVGTAITGAGTVLAGLLTNWD